MCMCKRLLFYIFIIACIFLFVCSDGFANDENEKVDIHDLFDNAVLSQCLEYFSIRDLIVKHAQEAAPFLKGMKNHKDFTTHVVASGMLSWIETEKINVQRTMFLLFYVNDARINKSGPAGEIIGIARVNRTGVTGRFGDVSKHFPAYDSSSAFLMEVATKGLDPSRSEFLDIRNDKKTLDISQSLNQEIAQAIAAALLVGSEDKDVIELFRMLYKTGGRTMRRVAAIGLARAGIETDEPIDDQVRWNW